VEVLRLREVWPSSFEPTTFPLTSSLEPFALSENAACEIPVTTSGYPIPSTTVNTTIIMMAGKS
jgi:hypothetical protein